MISFEEAYEQVLQNTSDFGTETVDLENSHGQVLAENIVADRDFPPFDRATKDGIALDYSSIENGLNELTIEGIAQAGSPQQTLSDKKHCIEVMTGAMVPKNADTVVMYEHLEIVNGRVKILKPVKKGQNIHRKGTDEPKGSIVLNKGAVITAAEIGVLASVGKSQVLVIKKPKITVISTGNELVDITEKPEPHQIRKSNSHSITAALQLEGIRAIKLHISDEPQAISSRIEEVLSKNDVLLLSGGVSKGKFDYLPEIFEQLGVEKIFHRVEQRPGKPFWFGKHWQSKTTIFAFPGNPASTYANYHIYFLPWLLKSLGLDVPKVHVSLEEPFRNDTGLTRFIRARASLNNGKLSAILVLGNGSGDLTSLTKANGFVLLKPNTENNIGDLVPFFPTKRLV